MCLTSCFPLRTAVWTFFNDPSSSSKTSDDHRAQFIWVHSFCPMYKSRPPSWNKICHEHQRNILKCINVWKDFRLTLVFSSPYFWHRRHCLLSVMPGGGGKSGPSSWSEEKGRQSHTIRKKKSFYIRKSKYLLYILTSNEGRWWEQR